MKRVMVRYKVKAGRADENAEYIKKVFDELGQTQPTGLRYASFLLDDGVTFVHLAEINTEGGSNPLSATSAFKAFQAELKARCDEPPVATELNAIGTYQLFSD